MMNRKQEKALREKEWRLRAEQRLNLGGGNGCFSGAVHADWPVSVSQSRELSVAKPLPL